MSTLFLKITIFVIENWNFQRIELQTEDVEGADLEKIFEYFNHLTI